MDFVEVFFAILARGSASWLTLYPLEGWVPASSIFQPARGTSPPPHPSEALVSPSGWGPAAGLEETFKKVACAFDTLSDTQKREQYDRYGETAEAHPVTPDGLFKGPLHEDNHTSTLVWRPWHDVAPGVAM